MEEGTWEDFLDIIGLTENERRSAVLNVVRKIPGGDPKVSVLNDLFEISLQIFKKRVTALHLLWFDSKLIVSDNFISYPSNSSIWQKSITNGDLKYLEELWYDLLGTYLVFLPEKLVLKSNNTEDEEEFIGDLLRTYKTILLKTPDANEILHLSID